MGQPTVRRQRPGLRRAAAPAALPSALPSAPAQPRDCRDGDHMGIAPMTPGFRDDSGIARPVTLFDAPAFARGLGAPATPSASSVVSPDLDEKASNGLVADAASTFPPRKFMALLLPGHNEELIIQATIESAIAAGQRRKDIFVVDDCSSDTTRAKAVALLGRRRVLTVPRSGKALAVQQAIKHFRIVERYEWLHVADADSVFGKDYFSIYKRDLDSTNYAAAVGFVQSLRGNWISKYRLYCYTYAGQFTKRLQSWMGMISVFPGPVTSFRTDVLHRLDFSAESLTEDFDLTLQFHRLRLGKILYIRHAVNYTQDPQTFSDFCRQTARWDRGLFQGIRKYRVGSRARAIDISLSYQLAAALFYVIELLVLIPLIILDTHPHRWAVLPLVMLADFFITSCVALVAAIVARRPSIMSVFATFYLLRMVELVIFVRSFVEVIILRKFRSTHRGWQTDGRRYALDSKALQDTTR
jgi:poly-beta-1,6-N-acetyl-D-glucosamine synthase